MPTEKNYLNIKEILTIARRERFWFGNKMIETWIVTEYGLYKISRRLMIIWIHSTQIDVETLDLLHSRFIIITFLHHLKALLDQIADLFFTNAGNTDFIAVPEVEAIAANLKVSIGISLGNLRRSSLLSKTSSISDAEDSKQNEQAEEDGGGLHCLYYFWLYFRDDRVGFIMLGANRIEGFSFVVNNQLRIFLNFKSASQKSLHRNLVW